MYTCIYWSTSWCLISPLNFLHLFFLLAPWIELFPVIYFWVHWSFLLVYLASHLGSALRKVVMLDILTNLLSPLGEAGSLGVSSWLYDAVLGAGILVIGHAKSLYQLYYVLLYFHLGCRSLYLFLDLSKKNLSMNCCWIGVYVEGKSNIIRLWGTRRVK